MKEKILIIDDDTDFLTAITTILGKAGYMCYNAQSSKQGFRMIFKVKPDLIILDEMMEDISSGFRFAKKLREHTQNKKRIKIPIIMVTNIQKVTGLDFNKYIGTPFLPVNGFFEKPVEPNLLLEKIKELLN